MNKERLIELARESGLEVHPRKEQIRVGFNALLGIDSTKKVERFAKAIRNEVLEEAARYCHDQSIPQQDEIHSDSQWAAAVLAIGIRNMKDQQ